LFIIDCPFGLSFPVSGLQFRDIEQEKTEMAINNEQFRDIGKEKNEGAINNDGS
jgi:hypothetical protein